MKRFLFSIAIMLNGAIAFAQTGTSLLNYGIQNQLVYVPDSLGNIIPDFSYAGYKHSEEPIPEVQVEVSISPIAGDNLTHIQNAINTVENLSPNPNGFRGAIELQEGVYNISGTLRITKSGVVLKGQGFNTILKSTATSQVNLIEMEGDDNPDNDYSTKKLITDQFVPIGARSFTIESGHSFNVGDNIQLECLPKDSWITLLDAWQYGWTPGGYKMKYLRKIVAIENNTITIDAPVVDPIDQNYATGSIYKFTWDNALEFCGVENIRLESFFASDEDENHAWNAVVIEKAKNCWVRNMQAYYFGYSCVNIKKGCLKISVEDCENWEPKSKTTGGRKYSFNVEGQQCLVKNCHADKGRHDFVSGSRVPGPNVFLHCTSTNQLSTIGPHHRWSTGQLYDNIDGTNAMAAENRTSSGSGHGWAGSQILFWNCETSDEIILQDPPSYHINWAIGCIAGSFSNQSHTGEKAIEPFGFIESSGEHVNIESLFEKQLCDRLENCPIVTSLGTQNNPSVHIYPNPFHKELRLDGYSGEYTIYSSSGQLIQQGTTAGRILIKESISNGLYFLILENNQRIAIIK